MQSLDSSKMKESLFGSGLTYEDVVDSFFTWSNQSVVGTEMVDRVSCLILESKPGRGESSSYSSVRTWVDPRRMVPLRVEKYRSPGRLAQRIDTTRVVTDDRGRHIPANLTIRGGRDDSVTELDGSRLKSNVAYSEREFSPEAIRDLTAPKAAKAE
jgi:hypothetical protein